MRKSTSSISKPAPAASKTLGLKRTKPTPAEKILTPIKKKVKADKQSLSGAAASVTLRQKETSVAKTASVDGDDGDNSSDHAELVGSPDFEDDLEFDSDPSQLNDDRLFQNETTQEQKPVVIVRSTAKITQLTSFSHRSVKRMEEEIRRARTSDGCEFSIEEYLDEHLVSELNSIVRIDPSIPSYNTDWTKWETDKLLQYLKNKYPYDVMQAMRVLQAIIPETSLTVKMSRTDFPFCKELHELKKTLSKGGARTRKGCVLD